MRLDALVAGNPGLPGLLRLRSAQAIAAANDRPPTSAAEPDAPTRPVVKAIEAGGAAEFAALLGWWYAPASREFIVDDAHLRRIALALEMVGEKVRAGCALTPGALDEAFVSVALDAEPLPDLLDASLSVAEQEQWPALLVAAELSAGACGRARTISASVARAVAPLASGLTRDVYVVPPPADDLAGALHAMAREARATSRAVAAYLDAGEHALARCREFGRGGASAAALVELLARRPAITVGEAARSLALTAPTAGAAVERVMEAKLVREITGRGRDRVFVYTPAVALAG